MKMTIELMNENEKKEMIHFGNDYVFKYVFVSEADCLNFLIQSVIDDPYFEEVSVINPELKVTKVNGKKGIQDIRGKDASGHYYGIEMQAGRLGEAVLNRILIYNCQLIVGQLNAGDDYEKLRRTEMIVFTTSEYDKHLHVRHVLCDAKLDHEMENQKMNIHVISLSNAAKIVQRKAETEEALTDLEIIAYALWKGEVEESMYKKANKKQRRILKKMEERVKELYKDPTMVSEAVTAALIEAAYQEDLAYSRNEGIAIGEKRGISIGEQRGIVIGEKRGLTMGNANALIFILKSQKIDLSEDSIEKIYALSIEELEYILSHFNTIKEEKDIIACLKQRIS